MVNFVLGPKCPHAHFVMVAWALVHHVPDLGQVVLTLGYPKVTLPKFDFFQTAHECIRIIPSLAKHFSFTVFSFGVAG
jgi:hypothetical protein